ncbi:MAG TPA: DNA-binding response regulator [Alphaproteobacteria bacterium]|nr:DNA-binding response regulator [Alphaproteobacteria bacterium]
MKILLVEDDKSTAEYIVKGLTEVGFNVDHFDIGSEGLFASAINKYDAIILDRMLPEVDGLKIAKTLRSTNNQTPIIFLTAMSDVDERVKGLTAGADDYLTKPFAFSELLARLQNIIKRNNGVQANIESVLTLGDLTVNLIDRSVVRSGKGITLQIKEFNILVYLLKNKGRVVTRTMLLEQIWNYNFSPQTNVVDVHIFNLRKQVDEGFDKQLIKTVRGVGYRIDDE